MIEFPTNPAVGTTVEAPDGLKWTWDGALWQLEGGGGGGGGGVFAVPAGTICDYIGTVPPSGWLGITGQTIANGQFLHPDLWTVLPANMKSGSSIVFPDTRGRISVALNPADPLMDTIGEVGGSKDAVVVSHGHGTATSAANNVGHSHGINFGSQVANLDHTHSGRTVDAGAHAHNIPHNTVLSYLLDPGTEWRYAAAGPYEYRGQGQANVVHVNDGNHGHDFGTGGFSTNHAHTIAGGTDGQSADHTHTVTVPPAGVTGVGANMPPFITFLKIIKG